MICSPYISLCPLISFLSKSKVPKNDAYNTATAPMKPATIPTEVPNIVFPVALATLILLAVLKARLVVVTAPLAMAMLFSTLMTLKKIERASVGNADRMVVGGG